MKINEKFNQMVRRKNNNRYFSQSLSGTKLALCALTIGLYSFVVAGTDDILTGDPMNINHNWSEPPLPMTPLEDLPECSLSSSGYCHMPQGGSAYIGSENTTILTKLNVDSTTIPTKCDVDSTSISSKSNYNWYKIWLDALSSTSISNKSDYKWYKTWADALGSTSPFIKSWFSLYNECIVPAQHNGGIFYSVSCITLLLTSWLSTGVGILRWHAVVEITPFLRTFRRRIMSFICRWFAQMQSLI